MQSCFQRISISHSSEIDRSAMWTPSKKHIFTIHRALPVIARVRRRGALWAGLGARELRPSGVLGLLLQFVRSDDIPALDAPAGLEAVKTDKPRLGRQLRPIDQDD